MTDFTSASKKIQLKFQAACDIIMVYLTDIGTSHKKMQWSIASNLVLTQQNIHSSITGITQYLPARNDQSKKNRPWKCCLICMCISHRTKDNWKNDRCSWHTETKYITKLPITQICNYKGNLFEMKIIMLPRDKSSIIMRREVFRNSALIQVSFVMSLFWKESLFCCPIILTTTAALEGLIWCWSSYIHV